MEIKDKPKSMDVREWITRKIAQETMIPEKTLRVVIAHNFDSAYEALKEGHKSIEISGFGKFYFNETKAKKEKEWLLQQKDAHEKLLISDTATEKERLKAERELDIIEKNLKVIKSKGL
jgi:nucleoid DNA-binding protein